MAARPGLAIGPGGSPGTGVGVVGVHTLQIGTIDGPAPDALQHGGVDGGGVGIQLHSLLQAVVVDARYDWPFLAHAGLLFHQGGQCDGCQNIAIAAGRLPLLAELIRE